MDSEKEKNRLSDIVLERVGLTGNLLSAPVSPSPEPAVDMPGHERQVRAGKVTAPEEYKRRFLVPAPKSVEWKTAYIDGRLHRRIAMLVRAAGCGSISGFIIRLLELHMEEHREDIAALLGEVYRPWDEGEKRTGSRQLMTSGIVLLLLLCILLWGGQYPGAPEGIQIVSTFSGISLTLFGGGYVVIPALHELFVDNLNWLTSAEFADGIAIGQITPGPIFITATFIGYKVAGITGALLATLAMFTPPAVLTVLLSRFVKILNQSSVVKAAMKGVRAAVIGMIFASAVTIGQTIMLSVVSAIIFLVTFFISLKYTISPVYLIIGAGVAGFILF